MFCHSKSNKWQVMLWMWLIIKVFVVTLFAPTPTYANPFKPTCGYNSCPKTKPGLINVHLVPHTHDDVGWLKSVDQYYYGQKNNIQRAGVQYILNTVVDELEKDKNRRFIYVESEFFHQWWRRQDEAKQAQVKRLVNQGRLEFIGGGWSMNDEAAAHYISIVDQMTLGHRFLRSVFGRCGIPRVSWQIDPFGHSREQSSLFAQMDFDGLFFGRLDWQDKETREKNLTMEMLWLGSDSLSEKTSSLFTGVLPNGYNPPSGFCFDDTCDDDPIVDSPDSVDYNVPQKLKLFMEHVTNQSRIYASNHLIMTMGSDFEYQNANPWFVNLDKLIALVNGQQDKIHVLYSTPSCYLKALNEAKLTWPTKKDDFFPYSSDPHAFWTGYFTSRPSFKRHERESSSILQACKQLQVFANLTEFPSIVKMAVLADAVGISQHHDAITGTAKQHVDYDYVRRLASGESSCSDLSIEALQKLLATQNFESKKNFDSLFTCRFLNVSQCDTTEKLSPNDSVSQELPIVLYNQLANFRVENIRVPLVNPDENLLTLFNSTGQKHPFIIKPIPKKIQNLPERHSNATHELLFAAHLQPIGITSYTLQQKQIKNSQQNIKKKTTTKTEQISDTPTQLQGKGFILILDSNTMLPTSFLLDDRQLAYDFNHSLRYYPAMAGHNRKFSDRASGAYIFRPNGTESLPIAKDNKVNVTFEKHGEWQELHLAYSNWAFEIIRVHPMLEFIEFDYLIGPIPIGDNIGKEVISEVSTSLNNKEFFRTDSNGRQDIMRQRYHRPTYHYNPKKEPISSIYYPVDARISLQDEEQNIRMTLLVDRSCGGSSIRDGQLETMLHRRLLWDDAFGVGEPLNETGTDGQGLIIRGHQWLHIGKPEQAIEFGRKRAQQMVLPPFIVFGPPTVTNSSFAESQSNSELAPGQLSISSLPEGANLLTVEAWKNNRVLIRLENIYEKGERPDDKPLRIDLRKLFKEQIMGKMVGAVEMSLSASHVKGSIKRLDWITEEHQDDDSEEYEHEDAASFAQSERDWYLKTAAFRIQTGESDEFESELRAVECAVLTDFVVSLKPMQIRTYLVRFRNPEQDPNDQDRCP